LNLSVFICSLNTDFCWQVVFLFSLLISVSFLFFFSSFCYIVPDLPIKCFCVRPRHTKNILMSLFSFYFFPPLLFFAALFPGVLNLCFSDTKFPLLSDCFCLCTSMHCAISNNYGIFACLRFGVEYKCILEAVDLDVNGSILLMCILKKKKVRSLWIAFIWPTE
jgi:hypothetical protein